MDDIQETYDSIFTKKEFVEGLLEGARVRLQLLEQEHEAEMKRREGMHPYHIPLDAGCWWGRRQDILIEILNLEEQLKRLEE